jgi:hypothetical protein
MSKHTEPPPCPDTVNGFHGPANARGCCPWCGVKWMYVMRKPSTGVPIAEQEMDNAYAYVYDPDYGIEQSALDRLGP